MDSTDIVNHLLALLGEILPLGDHMHSRHAPSYDAHLVKWLILLLAHMFTTHSNKRASWDSVNVFTPSYTEEDIHVLPPSTNVPVKQVVVDPEMPRMSRSKSKVKLLSVIATGSDDIPGSGGLKSGFEMFSAKDVSTYKYTIPVENKPYDDPFDNKLLTCIPVTFDSGDEQVVPTDGYSSRFVDQLSFDVVTEIAKGLLQLLVRQCTSNDWVDIPPSCKVSVHVHTLYIVVVILHMYINSIGIVVVHIILISCEYIVQCTLVYYTCTCMYMYIVMYYVCIVYVHVLVYDYFLSFFFVFFLHFSIVATLPVVQPTTLSQSSLSVDYTRSTRTTIDLAIL